MMTHFLLLTGVPTADITGYTRQVYETEALEMDCQWKHPVSSVQYTWRFQSDADLAATEKAQYVVVSKKSKLIVPRSHVRDSGHYMCTATSKYGTSTAEMVVKIIPGDQQDAPRYMPVRDASSMKEMISRTLHNMQVPMEFSAGSIVIGLLIEAALGLFILVAYIQYRQKVAKHGGLKLH
jgi:hypothetical protein